MTLRVQRAEEQEFVFETTYVPAPLGGISQTVKRDGEILPNVWKVQFFGDGIEKFSVIRWDEDKETSVVPPGLAIADLFETLPSHISCDKSLNELEALGVTQIKWGTVLAKNQSQFNLKANGKYAFEDGLTDDAKIVFATNAAEVSFECAIKSMPGFTNVLINF